MSQVPDAAPAPANQHVDTVVIGNGPSALILSYILHGHIPYYAGGHPDQLLHKKLSASPNLLDVDPGVYAHFRDSLKYSSQAIPFNTLLDALLRPGGDTSPSSKSCVEWRHEPKRAISHLVLGDSPAAGGQWADNPVDANPQIGTLSYAEQLSLPGYTFQQHWRRTKKEEFPELTRPSRTDVAAYFEAYAAATGISNTIRNGQKVKRVHRTSDGFRIDSHNVDCKHLVLASGVFGINLLPPGILEPLARLMPPADSPEGAVLIIGSGFTAADLIISTPPERKIIHIYNWDPERNPSPLRGCHIQAYPEYAGIYRQMRDAAQTDRVSWRPKHKMAKASQAVASTLPSFAQRDWVKNYEGLANSRILNIFKSPSAAEHAEPDALEAINSRRKSSIFRRGSKELPAAPITRQASVGRTATVQIGKNGFTSYIIRTVGTFHYATGRRGSLSYLDCELLAEVLPAKRGMSIMGLENSSRPLDPHHQLNEHGPLQNGVNGVNGFDMIDLSPSKRPELTPRSASLSHDFALDTRMLESGEPIVSGATLRGKIEATNSVQVAPQVFAVGSLTGDSLVRYAFGSACQAAGSIIQNQA